MTEAPPIKRPIGRSKVHNIRRDPVEDLVEGGKLKKSFKVNQAGPTMVVLQPQPTTRKTNIPFKPPAQVAKGEGSSRQFRAKQPIRRQKRNSPPPAEPPTLSQETLAAATASTQKKFRFMQTPGLNSKQQ
ncbi:hypothetical protein PIB30_001036 [Stylosanthes scabra]|uniref:Uncharacterized protein n=1 Tax=Stylosanthes scabra TaxID=79078 RepID=A0ABU6T299_9FABA|nr:hypothetical protein [Stylosanthes scabra]